MVATTVRTLDEAWKHISALEDQVAATTKIAAAAENQRLHGKLSAIETRVADLAAGVQTKIAVEVSGLERRLRSHVSGPRAIIVTLVAGIILGAVGMLTVIDHVPHLLSTFR